jgi:hypothetical protein
MTDDSASTKHQANDFLEKGLIALGIILASTLAVPVWWTLTTNGAGTYTQDLQASLLGFLVGIILVLTALLARTK